MGVWGLIGMDGVKNVLKIYFGDHDEFEWFDLMV